MFVQRNRAAKADGLIQAHLEIAASPLASAGKGKTMSIVNAIRQRIDARWKQILAYHYSAWLILTAGLMEGLHAALPVVSWSRRPISDR
jgi:hypothetical protein